MANLFDLFDFRDSYFYSQAKLEITSINISYIHNSAKKNRSSHENTIIIFIVAKNMVL